MVMPKYQRKSQICVQYYLPFISSFSMLCKEKFNLTPFEVSQCFVISGILT